jgi:hypothetical protein
VQRTDLSAEEEILVLLHFAGETGLTRRELGLHAQFSPPSITTSLQRLTSMQFRQVIELSSGRFRLTDLGHKRIRDNLASKLLRNSPLRRTSGRQRYCMKRISAWWNDFWDSIRWVGVAPDKAKRMGEQLVFILPLLGLTAKDVEGFRPFIPFLFAPLTLYVTWKAAISWYRTSGPIIWIGKIALDPYYNMWEVEVRNTGDREVIPSFFVANLLDADGKRIPRIDYGSLFQALHTVMGRVVALKIMSENLVRDAHALDLFKREVRAATALHHPNIVMAYDANEVEGLHFLVMEYIDGPDLGSVVRHDGPLPIPRALDFLRQTARALQYAHEAGMVHRDIKPSNLLLAPGDTNADASYASGRAQSPMLKVLDFGIARLRETNDTITVRKPGAVIGTPDYISPEQATDIHQADIRSDLYSLGCTFYFALSGQVPFPGQTIQEKVLHHALDDPLPVRSIRADIPDNLAAVVHRLMHKCPDRRFQTPADLLAELETDHTFGGGPGNL